MEDARKDDRYALVFTVGERVGFSQDQFSFGATPIVITKFLEGTLELEAGAQPQEDSK